MANDVFLKGNLVSGGWIENGGVHFDLSDFERLTAKFGGAGDQMPFALANAMSRSTLVLRDVMTDDVWPKHVKTRNKRFLSAALRVEKATKRKLSVALYDSLGRGHLALHARGGIKRSKKRLAIPPTGAVRRTAKGVSKNQKPRAIIDTTPKRALRVLPHGIFVGRGGRLHLVYAFRERAEQGADVPFDQAWNTIFRAQAHKEFPRALALAMATKRVTSKYDKELAKGRRQIKTKGAHGNSGMFKGSAVDR